MVNRKHLLFILLFTLLPTIVFAEEISHNYDETVAIIKEVMGSYYLRGPYMQYNYAKTTYGIYSPEEGTSQDILHSVCAAYSYDVYTEAFGMHYENDKFPRYSFEIASAASVYYNNHKSTLTNGTNDNYLIYYQNTNDDSAAKYVVNNVTTISDLAKFIQPGDIFAYGSGIINGKRTSGHVMMAYEVADRNNDGIVDDVLMLHSNGGSLVRTRIDGTSKVFYHNLDSKTAANNLLDIPAEGNIKNFWLSQHTVFKNLNCDNQGECVIIRPFYKDKNTDKAIFNYEIDEAKYEKSLLRIQYPGLFIEKTVNVGDNNSVNLNDTLTYTIKVVNKSNEVHNSSQYKNFTIDETISEYVSYISANHNGVNEKVYDGSNYKDHIVWTINGLAAGETITLTYTVKVNNDIMNVSKDIESVGEFYYSKNDEPISTGMVNNTIVGRAYNLTKSYQECYNQYSGSKQGLELIDAIYMCATGNNFHFTDLSFENMFNKKIVTAKGQKNAITFNQEANEQNKEFQRMILNNYWGGMVALNNESNNPQGPNVVASSSDEIDDDIEDIIEEEDDEELQNAPIAQPSSSIFAKIYTIARWNPNDANKRNKTISERDFKEGDVLIYSIDYSETSSNLIHTKEDGIYAYIFLNGEFVGNNYPNQENNRNAFTYQYYIDKSLNLSTHLYSAESKYTSPEREEILKYANYQTLYDKDNYIILRPNKILSTTTVESTNYKIDNTNKIISKIARNTSINSLDITSSATSINIENKTSGNAKTGDILTAVFGVEVDSPLKYKLSVKGDVTGTGDSNKDAKKIAQHIINKNILNGNEYLAAADYNGNDEIKMNDVMKLLKENN